MAALQRFLQRCNGPCNTSYSVATGAATVAFLSTSSQRTLETIRADRNLFVDKRANSDGDLSPASWHAGSTTRSPGLDFKITGVTIRYHLVIIRYHQSDNPFSAR